MRWDIYGIALWEGSGVLVIMEVSGVLVIIEGSGEGVFVIVRFPNVE